MAGPEDASVVLSTVLRGRGPVDGLLGALPAIEYRMGADLDPVDLRGDPEAARWLEAFIWPEQVEELAVLRAAVKLSAHGTEPAAARPREHSARAAPGAASTPLTLRLVPVRTVDGG